MEIERKFAITGYPDHLPVIKALTQRQGYLSVAPVVRIREEKPQQGDSRYILAVKGPGQLAREEVEIALSKEQFHRLAALIPRPLLEKQYRAYRLPDGHTLECSQVDSGSPTSFWYAEIEFASEVEANAFSPPAFLGRELTHDPTASMSAYWLRTAPKHTTQNADTGKEKEKE